MIIIDEAYLRHYGTPRHSGRYPWGSGEDPYQSNRSFLGMINSLKKEGLTDAEIARGLGITTRQLIAKRSIATNENKAADIAQAQRLRDKGLSITEIGRRMDRNESSVRGMLKPGAMEKVLILDSTANMLKDQVAKKGYIDIGVGVELHPQIGVSNTRLKNAVAKVKEEGYKVYFVQVQQLGTGHFTSIPVLVGPDVTYGELMKNKGNIQQMMDVHSDDGGRTWLNMKPPVSINSDRVAINYATEDGGGGALADGVIYVRPGVDDISLGASNYAQVRIAVDDTHFLKGMAVYKSDLPPGVDLQFNTNKTRAEAPTKLKAMKPMKTISKDGPIDQDNPFGATITRQNGVMNVLSEEGDWKTWSNTLSSQFLSKQSPTLAKQQLNMTYEQKAQDLDEIMSLTNPAVRRHLLNGLASDADASAVHLKAASLPRQAQSVLLPVPSLKPNEIYAPNHNNGDRVVLVRHPHGGIFEIPELVVNNKNPEGRRLIGPQAPDAVGIHPSAASKLSGADFDGDTALVILNNHGSVKTAPSLEGLKDFDARRAYPEYEGMKRMTSRGTQDEMGSISNLITDMTIKGANTNELARAVRHSMVVIDAEKHHLNYKLSAEVNGIRALKEKYQEAPGYGASTLVSRSGSTTRIPERKMGFKIDPETGKQIFSETGRTYVDKKTGKTVVSVTKVDRLSVTPDAHTLSSGTRIEEIYADHSNRLKAMADTARRESVNTKNTPYSPSAATAYSNEVATLTSKLNLALMNAPLERQAQILGNEQVAQRRAANPDMGTDELKKLRSQVLAEARARTGANREQIVITPSEWEAIQAGAITNHRLTQILDNTDLSTIRELATPRTGPAMTPAKISRAKGMASLGYTQAEIAQQLGVSVTAITNALAS